MIAEYLFNLGKSVKEAMPYIVPVYYNLHAVTFVLTEVGRNGQA
jgi:hypothetical protein